MGAYHGELQLDGLEPILFGLSVKSLVLLVDVSISGDF